MANTIRERSQPADVLLHQATSDQNRVAQHGLVVRYKKGLCVQSVVMVALLPLIYLVSLQFCFY
jgi:hypothetical protein